MNICNHGIIESYNNPKFSDCVITDINNSRSIYVNSFILRVSSEYFDIYFKTNLSTNKTKIIVDNMNAAESLIKCFYQFSHPFIWQYRFSYDNSTPIHDINLLFQTTELANMWLVSNNIKQCLTEYICKNITEIMIINPDNLIWIETNCKLNAIAENAVRSFLIHKINKISDELLMNEHFIKYVSKSLQINECIRRGYYNFLLETNDIEHFNDMLEKFIENCIIYKQREIFTINQYVIAHSGINFEDIDTYTGNNDLSESWLYHGFKSRYDIVYLSSIVPFRITKYYYFIGRWYKENYKHNAIMILMDNYLFIKDILVINGQEFKIKSIYWKNTKVNEAFPNEIYSVTLIQPLPEKFNNIYKLISCRK